MEKVFGFRHSEFFFLDNAVLFMIYAFKNDKIHAWDDNKFKIVLILEEARR